MSATDTLIILACDICQEKMKETSTGMVCLGTCFNFIPNDQLWRYNATIVKMSEVAEHADKDTGI